MTTFLQPDEAGIDVDFAESRKRGRDRVACFLHLRDLVYLHPKAASADAIAFVQSLEAAVIAQKCAREKRLAEARARAEGWRDAARVKAVAEQAKAESQRSNTYCHS
jgi:hypothetical protein